MPNKHGQTSKQIIERKVKNLRLILNNLREQPLSPSELQKIVFNTVDNKSYEKNLENYLFELEGLGLTRKDKILGKYVLNETKAVFQNDTELKLAFKHSKNIVLQSADFPGLEHMIDPLLDMLSFLEEDHKKISRQNEDSWFFYLKYLLQHIKNGYPEIHEIIKENKEIKSKHGKCSFGSSFSKPVYSEALTEEERKRLDDLHDLFVGKILRIVREVKTVFLYLESAKAAPGLRSPLKISVSLSM